VHGEALGNAPQTEQIRRDPCMKPSDQIRRLGAWKIGGAALWGGLALGLVAGIGAVSVAGHLATAGPWSWLVEHLTGRSNSFNVSSPTVVEKIRQLSRLETVEYSLDKIVEGDRQSPVLPDFLAGDKLLLVAHGEVIAGIDLGQLKASDVVVSGASVRMRLPAAQILSTRIDNARTRVYSRSTGLLVPADPNLESQVRQLAEQQITQAALDDGILNKAHQNACASITTLLYGLGFHQVDVQ
jgi:hypothetical protein